MAENDTSPRNISDDIDSLFDCGDDIDFNELFADDETSPPNPFPNIGPDTEPTVTSNSSVDGVRHKDNPRYGLGWERDTFSLAPAWEVEPSIESIIETLRRKLDPDKTYHVKHRHDGPYNKYYLVSYEQNHFVMKITLPICPKLKTESEVATLDWIYRNTELPVPKVKCYDSTRDSPVGFEWILMSRVEGRPLSQCWENIPEGSLHRIIKQIARYAAISFDKQFSGGICNLYPPGLDAPNIDPQPGPLVWMPFF